MPPAWDPAGSLPSWPPAQPPGPALPAPSAWNALPRALIIRSLLNCPGSPRLLNKEAPVRDRFRFRCWGGDTGSPRVPRLKGQQHLVSRLSRCSSSSLPPHPRPLWEGPSQLPPPSRSHLPPALFSPQHHFSTLPTRPPRSQNVPSFTPHPHPSRSTAPLRTAPHSQEARFPPTLGACVPTSRLSYPLT